MSAAWLGDALLVAVVVLSCPAGVLSAEETPSSADVAHHSIQGDTPGNISAEQIADPIAPPQEMHFCWTNCFTLTFDNGVYRRLDGTDETWTVERFTSRTAVLHRHDAPAAWNGFSADVVYQGQISNGRLISVIVNGNPAPDINLAWGFALNSLPGSNAERDRRQVAQAAAQAPAAESEMPPDDVEAEVDVDVSTADAPPPLLNYDQTPCPDQGYLWTPGYWIRRYAGYHWVPGAWVQPPHAGVLWTPGYWAYAGGIYVFHAGYWGAHVGYYGGINYGYGYYGSGFVGGRWVDSSFAYNRAASNVDARVIHNSYSEAVVNKAVLVNVSYNGGPAGTTAIPTAGERASLAEPHFAATARQHQIVLQSVGNPELTARTDGTRSIIAVTRSPTVTTAPAVVKADSTTATTVSTTTAGGARARSHVQSNTTLHPQYSVEHPVVRNTEAAPRDAGDSENPAAPKVTRAAPAKPPHPKQP